MNINCSQCPSDSDVLVMVDGNILCPECLKRLYPDVLERLTNCLPKKDAVGTPGKVLENYVRVFENPVRGENMMTILDESLRPFCPECLSRNLDTSPDPADRNFHCIDCGHDFIS